MNDDKEEVVKKHNKDQDGDINPINWINPIYLIKQINPTNPIKLINHINSNNPINLLV